MYTDEPIKLFPEVLFQASRHNQPATAYRLWFLAKHFDKPGCGFIPAKAFRQHLHALGIPRQTAERWLTQSLALGLLTHSGSVYALASWQAGAALAGISRLKCPVRIASEKLLGKGWLAVCWAAFLLHFEGMIARQTLQQLTSVPPRTQIEYEHQAGVINTSNYASYGKVADSPELALKLFGQPGHYTRAGEIRRRLPNSRNLSAVAGISLAARGRLKHINEALELVDSSQTVDVSHLPLYSRNPKQTKRFRRRHKKSDVHPKQQLAFIFELLKPFPRCGVYQAVAI